MTRLFIALLAAVLILTPSPRAQAQTTASQVIDAQIAAFQADDFDTAFGYASDLIRRIFGTPERFGQMVVTGYPMVHRPASVRYLDQVQRQGAIVQRVLIADQAGAVFVLEYEMIETPQGLRINGVRLVRDGGAGV